MRSSGAPPPAKAAYVLPGTLRSAQPLPAIPSPRVAHPESATLRATARDWRRTRLSIDAGLQPPLPTSPLAADVDELISRIPLKTRTAYEASTLARPLVTADPADVSEELRPYARRDLLTSASKRIQSAQARGAVGEHAAEVAREIVQWQLAARAEVSAARDAVGSAAARLLKEHEGGSGPGGGSEVSGDGGSGGRHAHYQPLADSGPFTPGGGPASAGGAFHLTSPLEFAAALAAGSQLTQPSSFPTRSRPTSASTRGHASRPASAKAHAISSSGSGGGGGVGDVASVHEGRPRAGTAAAPPQPPDLHSGDGAHHFSPLAASLAPPRIRFALGPDGVIASGGGSSGGFGGPPSPQRPHTASAAAGSRVPGVGGGAGSGARARPQSGVAAGGPPSEAAAIDSFLVKRQVNLVQARSEAEVGRALASWRAGKDQLEADVSARIEAHRRPHTASLVSPLDYSGSVSISLLAASGAGGGGGSSSTGRSTGSSPARSSTAPLASSRVVPPDPAVVSLLNGRVKPEQPPSEAALAAAAAVAAASVAAIRIGGPEPPPEPRSAMRSGGIYRSSSTGRRSTSTGFGGIPPASVTATSSVSDVGSPQPRPGSASESGVSSPPEGQSSAPSPAMAPGSPAAAPMPASTTTVTLPSLGPAVPLLGTPVVVPRTLTAPASASRAAVAAFASPGGAGRPSTAGPTAGRRVTAQARMSATISDWWKQEREQLIAARSAPAAAAPGGVPGLPSTLGSITGDGGLPLLTIAGSPLSTRAATLASSTAAGVSIPPSVPGMPAPALAVPTLPPEELLKGSASGLASQYVVTRPATAARGGASRPVAPAIKIAVPEPSPLMIASTSTADPAGSRGVMQVVAAKTVAAAAAAAAAAAVVAAGGDVAGLATVSSTHAPPTAARPRTSPRAAEHTSSSGDPLLVLSSVPAIRSKLAATFADQLARIHTIEASKGAAPPPADDESHLAHALRPAAPLPWSLEVAHLQATGVLPVAKAPVPRPATAPAGKAGGKPAAKSGGGKSAGGGKGKPAGKGKGAAEPAVIRPYPGQGIGVLHGDVRPFSAAGGGCATFYSLLENPLHIAARAQAIHDEVMGVPKKASAGKKKGKGKKKK